MAILQQVISTVLGVALIAVATLVLWRIAERSSLRGDVESYMRDGGTQAIKGARALLAIRGHRLDKRTRDALTVWLAGQP